MADSARKLVDYPDNVIERAADRIFDINYLKYSNMCWQLKYILKLFADRCEEKYDERLMNNIDVLGLRDGLRWDDIGNLIILELIRLIRKRLDKWLEFANSVDDDYFALLLDNINTGPKPWPNTDPGRMADSNFYLEYPLSENMTTDK